MPPAFIFLEMIQNVLSALAREILLEAWKTGSLLCFIGIKGKRCLSIGNKRIGDGNQLDSLAGELALRELASHGLIVRASAIEPVYKLATAGYLLADRLAPRVVN